MKYETRTRFKFEGFMTRMNVMYSGFFINCFHPVVEFMADVKNNILFF
jgi:hypothetical protein